MFEAADAALTARSASGIPASATSPTISSGALGFRDDIHFPVVTFSPLITSGYFLPNWPRATRSSVFICSCVWRWTKLTAGAFS